MTDVTQCSNCGTRNNRKVNPERCYKCGEVFDDVSVAKSDY